MSYKIVVKEKDKLKTVFKEILNLGGGAEIDDNAVATDKTWSSQKISNELSTKADVSHTHTISDVSNLQTELDAKVSKSGDTMTGQLTNTDKIIVTSNNPTIESRTTGSNYSYVSYKSFNYHYLYPRVIYSIGSSGGDSLVNAYFWLIPDTPGDISKEVGIQLKTRLENTNDSKRLSIVQFPTIARIYTSELVGNSGGTDLKISGGYNNTDQLVLKTNKNVGIWTSNPQSTFEVNGSFGLSKGVVITSDYAIADEFLILADATNNPITITLPSPSQGRILTIKKIDSSTNSVTIQASSSIDGVSSLTLNSANQYKQLMAYNSNWYVIGG